MATNPAKSTPAAAPATNALATFGKLSDALTSNMQVNSQHVVDIKISQYNDVLSDMRSKLEKEQRRLNKEIADVNKSISDVAYKLVKADAPDMAPLVAALTKYGCKQPTENLNVTSVNFDKSVVEYQYHISFNQSDRYTASTNLPVQYGSVKLTKELKDLQAGKAKLVAQLDDVSDKMKTVFDNIAKLPNLERKIRAQMAKFFISKTEGGDELITNIEDNISLPGLDALSAEIDKI